MLLSAAERGGIITFAQIATLRALHARKPNAASAPRCKAQKIQGDPMKTVWVYVDTSKQVGGVDHLKVFAGEEVAEAWIAENDPEGVAFEL